MPAVYRPAASRSERRRVSRTVAREQTTVMHRHLGTAPRYEPARDETCERHHRRLPCARCPQ